MSFYQAISAFPNYRASAKPADLFDNDRPLDSSTSSNPDSADPMPPDYSYKSPLVSDDVSSMECEPNASPLDLIEKRLALPMSQQFAFTPNELLTPIALTPAIAKVCMKHLDEKGAQKAMRQLVDRAEQNSLTVVSAVSINIGRTNLPVVRLSANKRGQVLPVERKIRGPKSQQLGGNGHRQPNRQHIRYTLTCLTALFASTDWAFFDFLSIYGAKGARKLASWAHRSWERKRISSGGRLEIQPVLRTCGGREDVAEFLIATGKISASVIAEFLKKGMKTETLYNRTCVVSNPCKIDLTAWVEQRLANDFDLTASDLLQINDPIGLNNRVVTHYLRHLNKLNSNVQTLHINAFSAGNHPESSHFVQCYAFATYLMKLDTTKEVFVFPVLELDCSDRMGSHLFLLICLKKSKRIYSIDVNASNVSAEQKKLYEHGPEIGVLSFAMDYYCSDNRPENPWKIGTTPLCPTFSTNRPYICADYALYCLTALVAQPTMPLPMDFNENDFLGFRQHLYNALKDLSTNSLV